MVVGIDAHGARRGRLPVRPRRAGYVDTRCSGYEVTSHYHHALLATDLPARRGPRPRRRRAPLRVHELTRNLSTRVAGAVIRREPARPLLLVARRGALAGGAAGATYVEERYRLTAACRCYTHRSGRGSDSDKASTRRPRRKPAFELQGRRDRDLVVDAGSPASRPAAPPSPPIRRSTSPPARRRPREACRCP